MSVCKNNHGSYTCECDHGYSQLQDKKTCIQEGSIVLLCLLYSKEQFLLGSAQCSIGNGGCSQLCSDTNEGIVCSCRAGFKLDTDKTSCIGKIEVYRLHCMVTISSKLL